MRKTRLTKSLLCILCIVLIAVTALITSGCNDNTSTDSKATQGTVASQSVETVLGEGEIQFDFTVTDTDGKETAFVINTDKKTVGDALLELNLIDGEAGDYGLYVKTVNGITVDYDTDGKYWAFYVNGEYATSGVDTTNIEAGATYSFKVE